MDRKALSGELERRRPVRPLIIVFVGEKSAENSVCRDHHTRDQQHDPRNADYPGVGDGSPQRHAVDGKRKQKNTASGQTDTKQRLIKRKPLPEGS